MNADADQLLPAKYQPREESIYNRALAFLETGLTKSELARRAGLNPAFLSLYLNPAGNTYPGDVMKYERKLASYLDRRDVETLAGVPTIETQIARQLQTAARMVRRCHIMGKGIGPSGIGKTRGMMWLSQHDEQVVLLLASRERGNREAVRSQLFKHMGIRGPRKRTQNRVGQMYDELVNRLRGTDVLIAIDQAHMLTATAIDFLVELWNATGAPQLWTGTEDLVDKLERNEQWASRLEFTFSLELDASEESTADVRGLVRHQIKSRLPELNGEGERLTRLCEKLARAGNFRRVEMRLATMLYLSERPKNKNAGWCDLFEQAGEWLKEDL